MGIDIHAYGRYAQTWGHMSIIGIWLHEFTGLATHEHMSIMGKMVALIQKGWHRNRHPPNPSQPWQLPTYTRIAVAAVVELWVLVRMAVDTHAAITNGHGSFGHIFL